MSSKNVQTRDQNSNAKSSVWSGESREQWVTSAIAAATASLRADAPSADSEPASHGLNANQN